MVMHIDNVTGIDENFSGTLDVQEKHIHRIFDPRQRRSFIGKDVFLIDFAPIIIGNHCFPGIATDDGFPVVSVVKGRKINFHQIPGKTVNGKAKFVVGLQPSA